MLSERLADLLYTDGVFSVKFCFSHKVECKQWTSRQLVVSQKLSKEFETD